MNQLCAAKFRLGSTNPLCSKGLVEPRGRARGFRTILKRCRHRLVSTALRRFFLTVPDRLIVLSSHAAIVSLGIAIAFFTRWTVAVLTLV